ncbi:MAG: HemN family oxidoreductase [Gammaproteobacteria bacterium]|jgi:oxygen-independent coproporphyrinogen-3 oxidase|nr:HemN family oxidoreductase [Gammaproteobacteria bacterium]
MLKITNKPPLSLYIHIPWCIRKCPYCDFNSHALKGELPERAYLNALKKDLLLTSEKISERKIQTIFIGGGTPSLFSPEALTELFTYINNLFPIFENIEITLEANPGTIDQERFTGFRQAGINRLSIGVQSFQPEKLKALGRIHDENEAVRAIEAAYKAGFDNVNIDLMYGLPDQTIDDALYDLCTAVSFQTTHLSWYQLTLEPNTAFYNKPPPLPQADNIWEMQKAGENYLIQHNFYAYEISAYAQKKLGYDLRCQHNLNYWLFGDYIAIGAGAHGKITHEDKIIRYWKTRHPKDYLNPDTPFLAGEKVLKKEEIPLEFMMNVLRLHQPISTSLFTSRTGMHINDISDMLNKAQSDGLLTYNKHTIQTTEKGKAYLNDLLQIFL